MTEHRSLYACVSLSADAFAAYRSAPLAPATEFDDWLPWLAAQSPSGPQPGHAEIVARAALESGPFKTAGDWIDSLVARSFAARSSYDPAAERWILIAPFFSDNTREYIGALAALRAVARFKDRPGNDLVAIFPYFWGDPDGVGAAIAQGTSTLWSALPQDARAEATSALRAFGDEVTHGRDPNQD
jgi:hypothetical protein